MGTTHLDKQGNVVILCINSRMHALSSIELDELAVRLETKA